MAIAQRNPSNGIWHQRNGRPKGRPYRVKHNAKSVSLSPDPLEFRAQCAFERGGCTTAAGGSTLPYKYYSVTGQKTYDSIVIPTMTFNPTMSVMVR